MKNILFGLIMTCFALQSFSGNGEPPVNAKNVENNQVLIAIMDERDVQEALTSSFDPTEYLLLRVPEHGNSRDAISLDFFDLAGIPYVRVNLSSATNNDTLITDFENNLAGVTADVGGEEVSGQLIANPFPGGINISSNVYELSYTTNSPWWGRVEFLYADSVLDDQATVYKAKLYSTVAKSNVIFEVEVDGNQTFIGDIQEIENADKWVELTFTIPTPIPAGVNKIKIRPDVGNQTVGDDLTLKAKKPNSATLYIDDIVCMNCTVGQGANTDATLSDLRVNDTTIAGFSSDKYEYQIELAVGTTAVPTVTATPTDANADTTVTAATALPGTTSVLVTAEDGQTKETYTVEFTVQKSTDATLSDLRANDTTIAGFDPNILAYTVTLPENTTSVPKVTATPTDANADTTVTAATALPGTTSVLVTAEDGVTTRTYTIVFEVENALGLADEFGFVSYPNPATDILTLQLADSKVLGAYSLLVTDAGGRNREVKVMQEGNSSIQVDVSRLASGLYFLRLQYGREEFISRFIKR